MPVPPAVTVAKSSHWYPMLFCGQLGQPAYLYATCCAGVTLTQCHLSTQILFPSQVVFFGFWHTGSIAYVIADSPILRDLTSLPSGERSIYNRAYPLFFFFFWGRPNGTCLGYKWQLNWGRANFQLILLHIHKPSVWSRREHLI